MDNLARISTVKRSEVEKAIQIAQTSDVIRRLIILAVRLQMTAARIAMLTSAWMFRAAHAINVYSARYVISIKHAIIIVMSYFTTILGINLKERLTQRELWFMLPAEMDWI